MLYGFNYGIVVGTVMKPFFSIIIPYHNSSPTIGALLDSIIASKGAPSLEVIVVDDGSAEEYHVSRIRYHDEKYKKINVKVIVLSRNHGPAAARNKGAAKAKGTFLLFLDSDVTLFPDALHNLWKIFTDDPDIVAVTGVWVKHQKSKAFFPNFKALRDWSYWINERDKSGYYYLFSTRCASIKRAVFERLGGFDETYKGALIEDIEFTYRVARRYAIIFAPNVRVRHEFEGFFPIARKYFWRAYYWMLLYSKRKKFDPVATTSQEAITALSGASVVGVTALLLCMALMNAFLPHGFLQSVFPHVWLSFFSLLVFLVLFHLVLIRKFLFFVSKEKGMGFAVKSFFAGLVLYCFIVGGTAWGKIQSTNMNKT